MVSLCHFFSLLDTNPLSIHEYAISRHGSLIPRYGTMAARAEAKYPVQKVNSVETFWEATTHHYLPDVRRNWSSFMRCQWVRREQKKSMRCPTIMQSSRQWEWMEVHLCSRNLSSQFVSRIRHSWRNASVCAREGFGHWIRAWKNQDGQIDNREKGAGANIRRFQNQWR